MHYRKFNHHSQPQWWWHLQVSAFCQIFPGRACRRADFPTKRKTQSDTSSRTCAPFVSRRLCEILRPSDNRSTSSDCTDLSLRGQRNHDHLFARRHNPVDDHVEDSRNMRFSHMMFVAITIFPTRGAKEPRAHPPTTNHYHIDRSSQPEPHKLGITRNTANATNG